MPRSCWSEDLDPLEFGGNVTWQEPAVSDRVQEPGTWEQGMCGGFGVCAQKLRRAFKTCELNTLTVRDCFRNLRTYTVTGGVSKLGCSSHY